MTPTNRTSRFGQRARRLCVALLAVAVLFAGVGAGHPAAASAQPTPSPAAAHGGHHDNAAPAAHHQAECDGPTHAGGTGPSPMKHGGLHGCCASACFPSFTNPEITFVPGRSVTLERLTPRAPQAAASQSLDALFKPPRPIA